MLEFFTQNRWNALSLNTDNKAASIMVTLYFFNEISDGNIRCNITVDFDAVKYGTHDAVV